jgi:hypothetical protein
VGLAAYSKVVAAAGTATITVKSAGQMPWIVSQISIEMGSAPVGATCAIRKNGSIITPMIAASDVASGEPYIQLLYTDVLTVEWAGCTPGQIGKATVLYSEQP